MARKRSTKKSQPPIKPQPIPPGATRKEMMRVPPPRRGAPRGGEPSGGPPGSGAGDRHAAGTPGGGTELGGLGGTTVAEGSPNNADLEDAMGSGVFDSDTEEDRESQTYDTDTG